MLYRLIVSLIIWMIVSSTYAQKKFTVFFEPEMKIEYAVSQRYSQSFGIENRNFVYNNSKVNYVVKQIDVSHLSTYQLKNETEAGYGIQYRFEKDFNQTKENELRLMQELGWESKVINRLIEQRFRTEQRIYHSTTKCRQRYEVAIEFPLNKIGYLKTETETLLEVAETQKPEFEQRLSTLLEYQKINGYELESGIQYRLADYTQHTKHELFFTIGIELTL